MLDTGLQTAGPLIGAAASLFYWIDTDLVFGSAIFGVGWGIAGICPGPALAGSASGLPELLMFVAAMAIGMALRSWRVRQCLQAGAFECKS